MSKILITGASGGLGFEVAKILSEKIDKQNIFVLARNAEKVNGLGLQVRIGDYNDESGLLKALEGIDILYFVSGNDIQNRVAQHSNVLNAAREAGVKHIFYTSAGRKSDSEAAPLFPVMEAHIFTENWLKDSGLKFTILRHNLYAEVIPMFIGNKDQLLQSKSLFLPAAIGKTAWVPRIDLAEAGAILLSNPGVHENHTYFLNGGELLSFENVSNILSEILETEIAYTSPTPDEFAKTMKSIGLPENIIGLISMFCEGIALGEMEDDRNDLEKILGRKPGELKEFLNAVY